MVILCFCRKTAILLGLEKFILGLFQVSRSSFKRGPILKCKFKLWKSPKRTPVLHPTLDGVIFCSHTPCRNNIAHVPTQILRKLQSNKGGKNQGLLLINTQQKLSNNFVGFPLKQELLKHFSPKKYVAFTYSLSFSFLNASNSVSF